MTTPDTVTALPGLESLPAGGGISHPLPAPRIPTDSTPTEPRPGSRAARMAVPLALDVLKDIAANYGVCLRPIAIRRIDTATGHTEIMEVPCGARLASKCVPCAEKNRRHACSSCARAGTWPKSPPSPHGRHRRGAGPGRTAGPL